ncbi:MAG: hypothetical protein CL897_02230 [Dehalococcoidia bacterium]|nr:hypothetical protein [Dehalococcoidia bacterium]HCV00407.1 hypothetical protein [Dehalococcoidia bacterium]|tara:strand:+ start:530 stop:862 length:333 start_codon:yes stop_codon:yes gene_type:complete
MNAHSNDELFLDLAEPLLAAEQAEEGTLMGFPCLRTSRGAFIAMALPRTGDLIVKVSADRVDELIANGIGLPFAPAGRRFREWVHIPGRDARLWEKLLREALTFVERNVQ